MSDFKEQSIAEREAFILGKPPRIPALTSDDIVRLAQEQTAKLRVAATGDTSPVAVADIPEMLLSLMCHPDLYERVAMLSIEMMARGTLSMRDRELVILRTGWLCQAPYEWGEHVLLAKRIGITSEEIEQVTVGSSATNWNEHERALLRAAEELRENTMISDDTWDVLSKTLDHKQLYELTVLVGQFTLVAYFQNSLRFRLSEGNAGLRAR